MNPVEYYTKIAAKKWYVTSPFGPRTGKYAGHHNGIDFGGQPCNAPIPTPYGGKVRAAGKGPGTWGNVVTIAIAPGALQLHAHLNTIKVKPGDVVKQGDIIGLNGGTNNTPTPYACHIHYEIRQDNGTLYGVNPRDPARFKLPGNSGRFYPGAWVEITTSTQRLNVRKSPGGDVVGQLPPGAVQQILDDPDNGIWDSGHHWWRATDGWIAEDWIKLTDAPAEPEPEPPETEPEPVEPEPPEPSPPQEEEPAEPLPPTELPEEPEPLPPIEKPDPPTPTGSFWSAILSALAELFRMIIDSLRGR